MDLMDRFESILEDRPGVFMISNLYGTQFYLGSSISLKNAVMNHLRELIAGVHFNSLFQQFYNELKGDIHLQVIYTKNLSEAKMLLMKIATDKELVPRIINPYFRRMSKKEHEMIMTLVEK